MPVPLLREVVETFSIEHLSKINPEDSGCFDSRKNT